MRPWVALILTGAAVALAVRHALGHRHLIAIPLLLLPALVLGWQEYAFRQDVHMFSRIASQIAQRPVTIECQRLSGAFFDPTAELGYVEFTADGRPTDIGRLERDACNALRAYHRGGHQDPDDAMRVAVNVLAHEAYHLLGIRSESRTECASMQAIPEVAQRLGATPEAAREVAEWYATTVYPRMPDGYRSAQCREDGELDQTPLDGVWP